MSRPLNPDRGHLEILASPDELRAWAAAAQAEDRTLSSWIRRVANDEVKRSARRSKLAM